MTPPIIAGTNGMPRLELAHDAGSFAHLYLHGAQVTSWIPVGSRDVLYLSRLASFAPGEPIRGGIPLVFPQFADAGPLPRHGWLPTTEWVVDTSDNPDDRTHARLFTEDSEATRSIWPHRYTAELDVTLTERSLNVALSILNTGLDSFSFGAALHSYFAVDDVRETLIEGLSGAYYLDKTAGMSRKLDNSEKLVIDGETDRIYAAAPKQVVLHDHASGTSLRIASTGFRDLVVWNPWKEGAERIADMPDDDYLRMLCIEPALAASPYTLSSGAHWSGSQHLTILEP